MRIDLKVAVIVISIITLFVYYNSRCVLNDDDQVVITTFGKAVGVKDAPGAYFRIPILEVVHYFKKQIYLTEWEQEILTEDRKPLSLATRASWKISDPVRYYERLNSYDLAQDFVIKHVGEAERSFVTSHTFSEVVGKEIGMELKDVKCDPRVEAAFLVISKEPTSQSGISLDNVEAKVTSPINMRTRNLPPDSKDPDY